MSATEQPTLQIGDRVIVHDRTGVLYAPWGESEWIVEFDHIQRLKAGGHYRRFIIPNDKIEVTHERD